MARFYFHFSSKNDRIEDRKGVELEGPHEAHMHAVNLIRRTAASLSGEPWRDWIVDVSNADGRTLLTVPFHINVLTRDVFGRRAYRDLSPRKDQIASGEAAKSTEGEW
jgi:hypothetical protein